MKRILSGVQPTGNLHLGNYLGAIRNWVNLQDDYEGFYSIVDLHAITVWQDPKTLQRHIREVAAAIIASGLKTDENVLFVQSQVPAHTRLTWIFNCVARLGWLNRMTQFKEKAGKHKEKASIGLYDYPVLMAADILAYKATHVPVGDDQKQHLELTRDIAQKFNHDYGVEFFPVVEPVIMGEATRVMSLRDGSKKMSKSDESDYSRINLTDSKDDVILKIKKAKTDPHPLPETVKELEDRPEASNLLKIYASLANQSLDTTCQNFAGSQFSQLKSDLSDLIVSILDPISQEMNRLLNDISELDKLLEAGNEKARTVTNPIVSDAYKIVGLG